MILVIDNYDSFVHNVARYFAVLGAACEVVRNDALTIAEIEALRPEAIVLSPGPCTPDEAGISRAIVRDLSGHVPILGVCLGHQCIGAVFGGRIARAARPMHGLTSDVRHEATGLFAGLPSPLPVGRYHSLIVEPTEAMDRLLSVDARSEEGEIMALSHRSHPTWGVQFHPESVLTPSGLALFGNFLALARAFDTARLADVLA
jgi:para-aminobenzoate synthetase component 2